MGFSLQCKEDPGLTWEPNLGLYGGRIEPGPLREASTLEKSHSNSLLICVANRNIYIYERVTSGECSRQY